MKGRALTVGLLTALVLGTWALPASGAVAEDDSLQFWLDLLSADTAEVDAALSEVGAATRERAAAWRWDASLATGYDSYVQTYSLALEDTTESLAEYEVTLAAEGVAGGDGPHVWRIAPKLSAGSERTREWLETGWSWRPDESRHRLDAALDLRAVQYGGSTDWYLSSDWREAAADLRWRTTTADASGLDVRLDASQLRYDTPSTLEVDRDDVRVTAALASGTWSDRRWKLGLRGGRRAHPDTAAIDRTMWGADLSLEVLPLDGPGFYLTHRSERRDVRDQTARPSSWGHWTSAEAVLPLPPGVDVRAEFDLEVWTYDESRDAYTDQTRWSSFVGLGRDPLDGPGWQMGMALERLTGDDPDEVYGQIGVRGGFDVLTDALSASCSLELGRRDYEAAGDTSTSTFGDTTDPLYTDFTYVEVWASATWRLHERLSLDALGSWMPESHTEDEDDQSLGFASVRAIYRF